MHSVLLFAFVAQVDSHEVAANHSSRTHDFMETFVDTLVEKLFDSILEMAPLHQTQLDNMTLVAMQRLPGVPPMPLNPLLEDNNLMPSYISDEGKYVWRRPPEGGRPIPYPIYNNRAVFPVYNRGRGSGGRGSSGRWVWVPQKFISRTKPSVNLRSNYRSNYRGNYRSNFRSNFRSNAARNVDPVDMDLNDVVKMHRQDGNYRRNFANRFVSRGPVRRNFRSNFGGRGRSNYRNLGLPTNYRNLPTEQELDLELKAYKEGRDPQTKQLDAELEAYWKQKDPTISEKTPKEKDVDAAPKEEKMEVPKEGER